MWASIGGPCPGSSCRPPEPFVPHQTMRPDRRSSTRARVVRCQWHPGVCVVATLSRRRSVCLSGMKAFATGSNSPGRCIPLRRTPASWSGGNRGRGGPWPAHRSKGPQALVMMGGIVPLAQRRQVAGVSIGRRARSRKLFRLAPPPRQVGRCHRGCAGQMSLPRRRSPGCTRSPGPSPSATRAAWPTPCFRAAVPGSW